MIINKIGTENVQFFSCILNFFLYIFTCEIKNLGEFKRIKKKTRNIDFRSAEGKKNFNYQPIIVWDNRSENEKEVDGYNHQKTSFNIVNYISARETNLTNVKKINPQYGLWKLISQDLFKQKSIDFGNRNKVLSSQWLNNNVVIFSTKSNELIVYDSLAKKLTEIQKIDFDLNAEEEEEEENPIRFVEKNTAG